MNSFIKKGVEKDDEKVIELNDIELKVSPEVENMEEPVNFYTELLNQSSFDMLSYICARVCLSDDNEEWLQKLIAPIFE